MAAAENRSIQFEEDPQLTETVEARIIGLGDRGEIRLTQNPAFDAESVKQDSPGQAQRRPGLQ
jgi:hypothetical protein